ncbi:MAG: acetoacetate--CoA ligase [Hyphomicrobiales bacterium]
MTDRPLWTPSPERMRASNLACFKAGIEEKLGIALAGFPALHAWSVAEPEAFWSAVWDYCGIKAFSRGDRVLADGDKLPGARFFPDARFNYAQNLLVRDDDAVALIYRCEDRERRSLTWKELNANVARLHHALAAFGLKPGDRVAGVVPNSPETLTAFLATASLGGIWSSCSPDFGPAGILDRFRQIEPRVLVSYSGYVYAGKRHAMRAKLAEVVAALPSVELVIIVDEGPAAGEPGLRNEVLLRDFTQGKPESIRQYADLPFNHPLYILYSSGTTGIPKCIVHSAGGVFLKHVSEHVLHCDVKREDRLFYFTTCGWMMWNWLVSGLSTGATLLLYDGSPFHPSERVLFDFAVEDGMTIFGTSAKYIDSVKKTGWEPKSTHDLSKLKTMLSTGSPLSAESFEFVYTSIKSDLHLASISGGTDICGCFVAGNPLSAVYAGEIQGPTLGLAVDVYDETGAPLPGKGELVCTNAFPSMPLMFWNDPEGDKYRAAYFQRFPGLWCHGDFAEWTDHGGMIIHGRSDATLNPGGVRIGTAEIYAQVEKIPDVLEALAIGQTWQDDVRVVLFVRLRPGVALDDALMQRIKLQIRTGASPRHVPAKIVAITDIPRTKSGKITELAVRDVVHGRAVKNKEALANPEALDLYADLEELRT